MGLDYRKYRGIPIEAPARRVEMCLIANIEAAPSTAYVPDRDALAYLTSTGSGCLLSLVLHIKGQRFIGGKLVKGPQEPVSGNAIRDRLISLSSRLSCNSTSSASAGMHIENAARLMSRNSLRRRSADQSVLSARQLRISTALLKSNLDKNLHISKIARACGISESHLRRAFRTCTGMSPKQWRQERRMQFCRHKLVTTDAPLAVISREAGFAVPSHFSRVFARSSGLCPSEWRRAFQSLNRASIAGFTWQIFGRADSTTESISRNRERIGF